MSFNRVGYVPPTKPNFINNAQPQMINMSNRSNIQAYNNNKSVRKSIVDKLARPALAAGFGLVYIMVVVKNPVFNAYGLQKAIMFGLSSIVADYLGNFLFNTAKIKKELGMFDYEDILFEPLISGVVYAGLNKYYMGVNGKFLPDIVVGSACDFGAGLITIPMRM